MSRTPYYALTGEEAGSSGTPAQPANYRDPVWLNTGEFQDALRYLGRETSLSAFRLAAIVKATDRRLPNAHCCCCSRRHHSTAPSRSSAPRVISH